PQPTSTHAQTATSPTRRSSDLATGDLAQHHLLLPRAKGPPNDLPGLRLVEAERAGPPRLIEPGAVGTRCRPERVVPAVARPVGRAEAHTSELQSLAHHVCRPPD